MADKKTTTTEKHMTLTIKIKMDNEAFDDGEHREVARILKCLTYQFESDNSGSFEFLLHDANGNPVGKSTLED